ncbi:MAG TPA: PD-(D/E)XK nuclease family protein [Elusimicrobiota bacterium]|nr:PD-(D/E)XK nuclease family protein [Elusimicrobiota bacterium]
MKLFRADKRIYSIFSAFGNIKETNITAAIGYLISTFPNAFRDTFLGKRENIEEVHIEQVTENGERFDIVLMTNMRTIVIEAKLGLKQDEKQIKKYVRRLEKEEHRKGLTVYLLDHGSRHASQWIKEFRNALPGRIKVEHVIWDDIYNQLCRIMKYKRNKNDNNRAYCITEELCSYMEENDMIQQSRKEIYVRDLSGASIELFFKYRIYKCQPEYLPSAQGSAYFAPHFTSRAPADFAERSMIKIERGISWIAPIVDTNILKRNEIETFLKSKMHPQFKEATKEIFRETSRGEVMILLLEEPFLAFLTPISKKKLGIHGAMGSRVFTFKDLFTAVGKE